MAISSIAGRVALVTGGSSGLGLAVVRRLLSPSLGGHSRGPLAGAVIFDKQPLVEPLFDSEKVPDNVDVLLGDIRHESDVNTAVDRCVSRFGRLDYLINCAGVAQAFQFYNHAKRKSFGLDTAQQLFEINTLGTFNVIRFAAAAMVRTAEGRGDLKSSSSTQEKGDEENKSSDLEPIGTIINASCISTLDGIEGQTAYASSKGGLNSLALTAARDLADVRIRCVTLALGLFSTRLMTELPVEVRDMWSDLTPGLKRLGEPQEFAHLVHAILENPMINGTTIRLDGGLRLQLP